MVLRLGDAAPDFSAQTTQGELRLHQWLGDAWGLLFSHPKDYTPVCTTELAQIARLSPEFARRGVKVIGLSVDPLEEHEDWIRNVGAVMGVDLDFPLIADPDRSVANLYGMLHPNAADTTTVRTAFIIDPAKRIRLSSSYPVNVGRSFGELLRAIDALQLGDHYPVATPADWQRGDRVIVSPRLSDEETRRRLGEFEAVSPYLRFVDQPD
ncbi:peroxiredoxin [Pseudenhygromyxa sp. WMMC2535]|uniref:peroxiredoxin n=1 Tax=Pseudenhygromyxa sp. WMMC2535 TaxID=2712867 RepID=UPI001557F1B5|nr:peroxiredoxin [Pseudenhygromyxa sp. WMMC2535]NVB40080.1 peroxiredoxin [Pseudenhygromyxa sp. WMMC2535]